MAGTREIHDAWSGESGLFTDEVFEAEKTTHSSVLGLDGRPIRKPSPQPIGFLLKPRGQTRGGQFDV